MTVSSSDLSALRAALLNTNGTVPLHDRFRALFTLKSLKNDEAVQIISEGTFRPSFIRAIFSISSMDPSIYRHIFLAILQYVLSVLG
jgi:hypothetical protein